MTKNIKTIISVILFIAAGTIHAAAGPVYKTFHDVAINGYDPVAYFTENKPVEGSEEYSLQHNNAKWLFSSEENKNAFEAEPEKYEPKYGGHCAYAMSKGYIASTVPEAWSIVDGSLYLNYSLGVKNLWDKDQQNYITQGDENWPNF